MHNYTLTTPKDIDGQPIRLFKATRENHDRKLIDQLSGICSGILADGIVNEQEAVFFADWVRKNAPLEPVWPFTEILARVEAIFSDGICTENERQELKEIMEALCGHVATKNENEILSTTLPFNSPQPDPIIFQNHTFNITGRFAFGARKKVIDTIAKLGGAATDSTPTRESNYLVVGLFASRDWIHSNFGRKIERAVELRETGSGLAIISEEHWKRYLR